jgi:hypothetical protein
MGISQLLYEAIQKIDHELAQPTMVVDPRRKDIIVLLIHMKEVQQKLDADQTEIDDGDPS